ncbi:MAG: hypothetical protein Q7J84_02210 [Sulfuricaulis sp.]|nr:hypothetical protein [Sulfuricaulis sp.]
MFVVGSSAQAASSRRSFPVGEAVFHKSEWLETGDDPILSPTIFLIEQPPNCTLPSHFHRQNQFQLFVEGAGAIGPTQLAPVTVHYVGAYTGYGPLVSGAQGIQYFTIRPVCESGGILISEAKEKMVRGPKRHASSAPLKPASMEELSRLHKPTTIDVIAVAPDGLGARIVRAPPHAVVQTDFPPQAAGTFAIVLSGSVLGSGCELSLWDSLFASTRDELPQLCSGPQGAEVIFLFTPAKAQAYL